MNMLSPIETARTLTRTEVAGMVAIAARTVPPLWPLESAIAVNPLAGFEDLPFADAVTAAARRFGARRSLPLSAWRSLVDGKRIEKRALRDAAIRHVGGAYRACAAVAPGVTVLDLLMARLLLIEPEGTAAQHDGLPRDAAFIAKWCAAFFDAGVATMPMPLRELGLYRAVLALADHDPEFVAIAGEEGRRLIFKVPRDPYEAISEGLAEIAATGEERDLLAGLVARLPGWAGHIRWRTDHADADLVADAPATMADLIALWMLLARAGATTAVDAPDKASDASPGLAAHFAIERNALDEQRRKQFEAIAAIPNQDLGMIFMQAAEWTHANALVAPLEGAARSGPSANETPAAQLVFCIDVRSEPFRRALEARGRYETFGYAGFFGLPVALHPFAGERRRRLLPVLIAPQHDVGETSVPGREAEAVRIDEATRSRATGGALFSAAKSGTGTAFATAEATGLFAALAMAARTIAPLAGRRLRATLERRRAVALRPAIDGCAAHAGFTLAEKVGYAATLFRLTGLGPDTARLIALVGHGGSAVNNPYAAALDCGACGGHAGGTNARLLAAMLNDSQVRDALARQGLALPVDTVFVAAEHDTTTDEVTIFDATTVPASHRADLATLESDLAEAGRANRARRAAEHGCSSRDLIVGASHWGEVRPEWGLAGNASFVVGPRWMTSGLDLSGRTFLHSYDWSQDEDGGALATILTAPMVVAQWINCQYLFSTLDNERFGAGDKATHNVTGGIGVVRGNGGDLCVGLPRQSLFADDGRPYHTPQRLLTVVLAPIARVEAIVEANDLLGRLFGNGWVQLVVIDPASGKAMRWRVEPARQPESTGPLCVTC